MKKIVSVLLCLVMAMSLCTVAFAAATDCDHMGQNFKYVSNGNGTHKVICDDCDTVLENSEAVPCYYENDICTMCHGKKPAECKHPGTDCEYVKNNDGTHKIVCKCGKVVKEAEKCVYENGVCKFCKDTCDHMANEWVYVSNGNGTHDVICKVCGKHESPNMPCTYEDGKCITCKDTCDHMANKWVYKSNGNGTHDVICEVCGKHESPNMACTYENGKCITCGAVKPVATYTVTYVAGDTGADKNGMPKDTEKYEIGDMAVIKKIPATAIPEGYTFIGWTDGVKTYEAGARVVITGNLELTPVLVKQAADCDHVGVQKVVDNKDGKTHSVICPKCDEVLYTDVAHYYAEDTGKCACGAVKPAECKHEGAQKLVPNKDKKTHNAYCPECGELMSEKIPHTYQYNKKGEFVGKGGAYCLCGAKKSTSSAGSNTGSTTTTTTTKSPKTGDMGVVLYAATALLSLSGTAVVIKKRKNDK